MLAVTEWTFTADVSTWVNLILKDRPDLPFSKSSVEDRCSNSQKRRDFTLYLKDGSPFLTGEMKMPDKTDGGSPYRESVVIDAHDKADDAAVEYYFTWNVNRCVLWKTFEVKKPIISRHIEDYSDILAAPIKHSADVRNSRVQDQIKKFLLRFLERCAALISGAKPMMMLTPDEKFLNIWEAALQQPVAQTLSSLDRKYEKDSLFTAEIDGWMREEQGWIISHSDEEIIRDNLERAAKLSCYVLAGKIIFYKALRRKFTGLQELQIPETTTTGAGLLLLLDKCFQSAMEATGDYETVFKSDYGSKLPFIGDEAVDGWRDLSLDTDGFDFTQIDYEIIGQIFERMLSAEERHKYGQHYTRSEVVDLINAFCIRMPDAKVMDPSCGGGTFLVRAYARLKQISGGTRSHDDLIRQLFGLDISSFPAYLTTINLATRDLVDRANYPRVANRDFFLTTSGDQLFHVPLGNDRRAMETLDKVDAVVGNPPYVRQEKINEYYGSTYKKNLQNLAERESPTVKLSGRSDLHCYFFPHALTFLNEGGYIGLLVSSGWLDTGYGFLLQKFLLDHFEIVSIIESSCEPWFTGARVTTSAVILHQQSESQKRRDNLVKFVRVDVPLSNIVVSEREDGDVRITFDELRERIENAKGKEEFTIRPTGGDPIEIRQENVAGMKLRVIRQADLERLGCLPLSVEDESEDDNEDGLAVDTNKEWHSELVPPSSSEYTGYKWGIFLRAPDVFFKLLKRGGSSFVPMFQVAHVAFGTKSGCDKFFFVKDVTEQKIKDTYDGLELQDRYGISPADTNHTRIVQDGNGKVHLIEKKYLGTLVQSMKEIDGININDDRLGTRILLVSERLDELSGTHVAKYIRWGESEGYNLRSTCASRDLWYELVADRQPGLIFPKLQQYRHIVSLNERGYYVNSSLLDIQSNNCSAEALCAILNSTIVALFKHQYGRLHGREASLQMDVYATKMMLIPNPGAGCDKLNERLKTMLNSVRGRAAKPLVDVDGAEKGLSGELAMVDRQELDDVVLEVIGIADAAERQQLRSELYAEMTHLYRSMRVAEKLMQKYRTQSARQGRVSPQSIASEIWNNIDPKPHFKTPLNFVRGQDSQPLVLPAGPARLLAANLLETAAVSIGAWTKDMKDVRRAKFVKAISDEGIVGPVDIPNSPEACNMAVKKYENHCREIEEQFTSLVAMHTADEKMQDRVIRELRRKMRQLPVP